MIDIPFHYLAEKILKNDIDCLRSGHVKLELQGVSLSIYVQESFTHHVFRWSILYSLKQKSIHCWHFATQAKGIKQFMTLSRWLNFSWNLVLDDFGDSGSSSLYRSTPAVFLA